MSDTALTWRAWPAGEKPLHAAVAAIVMIAFAALILTWLLLDGVSLPLSVLAGVGSLVVLFLALNRFFLPSRFETDQAGLTAKYPLRGRAIRIEWRSVRRFHHDEHGGFLSRRAVPSRFDSWQGVHILWGQNRAGALEAIRAHLHAASAEVAAATHQ